MNKASEEHEHNVQNENNVNYKVNSLDSGVIMEKSYFVGNNYGTVEDQEHNE